VEEARRNLRVKAPRDVDALEKLLGAIELEGEASAPLVRWALEQGLPLKDAPILAAAVGARVDLLVTGDRKHFGHLYGTIRRGVEVVAPAEALARLL
jgi:hypothetical protein